jgi:hypothetical protein
MNSTTGSNPRTCASSRSGIPSTCATSARAPREIEALQLDGHRPRDLRGERHPRFNVDHVVDAGGAGLWAIDSALDLDLPRLTTPVFHVNRSGNLWPEAYAEHEVKTLIKHAQTSAHNDDKRGRWILSLVRKRGSPPAPAFKVTLGDLLAGRKPG